MRYSRIVSSCAPVRFLMTEIARRTAPERLEVAQEHHRVGEIGDIHRRLHVADEAVLGDREEGRGALPVQVLEQLVHVQHERVLAGHGGLVAVEAVDHDRLDAVVLDATPHALGELAGRQLGGVDLLDEEPFGVHHGLEVDAEALRPLEQEAELLVEHEQGRALAALDRALDEGERQERLARARGAEDQDA